MTTSSRPAFYDRIDEALQNRTQLAIAMETFASEINLRALPSNIKELLTILRSPSQAEQFAQDGFNASWLPLILRSYSGSDTINLSQIASEVLFAEETRKSRWRGIAYPLSIVAIALFIFILLAVTVLPTFQKLFSEFELTLPLATQIMLKLSNLINDSPIYFCFLLSGIALAGLSIQKIMAFSYSYLEASSALGVLFSGSSISVKAMGQFTSTLAELLGIGTPLDQAILIAGRASQNLRLKISSEQMASEIGTSDKFRSDSTVAYNFPALVRHALEAGPNGTTSVPLLRQISKMYFDRLQHRFDWSAGLFAPFAMVGVGLIVGFVVMSLFLPLISLITSLSG